MHFDNVSKMIKCLNEKEIINITIKLFVFGY
jgi:hypothetical protein